MKSLRNYCSGCRFCFRDLTDRVRANHGQQPSLPIDGTIPNQFTCKGANQIRRSSFHGIPKEAKSLVLIVDDPDAPGGLFTHWIVWNIEPATTHFGANSVRPAAAQGTNDFGKIGYGGPCPPPAPTGITFGSSPSTKNLISGPAQNVPRWIAHSVARFWRAAK